jgi:hypothetical protein
MYYNSIAVPFAQTPLHLPPHVLLLVIHKVCFGVCNHRCPASRKLMIPASFSLSSTSLSLSLSLFLTSTCTYALRYHQPVTQQSREMTAEGTGCAVQHDALGARVMQGSCSGGRRCHLVMER